MRRFDMERQSAGGGPKKWFMLQMWRMQQIAQIATIALLAINLAFQIYAYMSWRGSIFDTPYTGVPLIALVLVAIIWAFSIVWDLRMRMWREQHSVLVEKNPYMKEKMTAKEIAVYGYFWLPLMDKLSRDDHEARKAVDHMRDWLLKAYTDDESLVAEVEEITRYLGRDSVELEKMLKK